MPENNPFSILTDDTAKSSLSAREQLVAEMGLNPPSKTEAVDGFAGANSSFLHTDFVSSQEPAAASTNKEDVIVDAIFTSTEPETRSDSGSTPDQPIIFIDEAHTELETALSTSSATEQGGSALNTMTEQPTDLVEPVTHLTSEPVNTAALKSLDRAGLEHVVAAYSDLQQKLAANQTLIGVEREAIAELRNHMRQLNALGHEHEVTENHAGLDLGRKLIQADSCTNLIRSISQVNEVIQQDSQRAAQLMAPIKAGVEVLELRIKHINAIENLLAHMQEGLMLQKQLSGADALMQDLAKHLGLALN